MREHAALAKLEENQENLEALKSAQDPLRLDKISGLLHHVDGTGWLFIFCRLILFFFLFVCVPGFSGGRVFFAFVFIRLSADALQQFLNDHAFLKAQHVHTFKSCSCTVFTCSRLVTGQGRFSHNGCQDPEEERRNPSSLVCLSFCLFFCLFFCLSFSSLCSSLNISHTC